MERVFFSQSKLDEWLESGNADIDQNTLKLASGQTLDFEPAVYFDALIDGQDESSLLGTVLGQSALAEKEVEHYADSAILGDTAYQVIEGYIGAESAPAKGPAEGELAQLAKAF